MLKLKNVFFVLATFSLLLCLSCSDDPVSPDGNNETGTVTDIDGNVYKTIKIGNQWWMAENLKVTHYRNGDAITNVTDNVDWARLSTEAYCALNNDKSEVETYGLLYTWYALVDSRNISPAGWHAPTDEEWKQLEVYLGMSTEDADITGLRGSPVSSKLKTTSGWENGNGTNESNFSALSGGSRNCVNGGFSSVGSYGYWWTSSSYQNSGSPTAWRRGLYSTNSDVERNYSMKQNGFSIRLVRD